MRSYFVVALLLLGSLSASKQLENGSTVSPTFQNLEHQGTEIFRSQDNTEDIRLSRSLSGQKADELLDLDFETEHPATLRDEAGRFQIRQSSYIRSADARMGHAAALFSRKEHRIVIDSPAQVWPFSGSLQSFSVQMWIKPLHFFARSSLFKRELPDLAFRQGRDRRFELYIKNEILVADFQNVFQIDDRPVPVLLTSRSKIPIGRWTHVTASYDETNGTVSLFINGEEHQVEKLPIGARAFISERDRSPIVLCENYSGLMDELNLSRGTPLPQSSSYGQLHMEHNRPVQAEGIARSSVEKLPEVAERARISYRSEVPEGSVLQVYFRSSLRPFDSDTKENLLPWKIFYDRTGPLQPFQYYQWKAVFKADAKGKQSPVLKSVFLSYDPARAPDPVQDLRLVPGFSRDEQVCLEWSLLPETEGAVRYEIYYGYHPDEMVGLIASMRREGLPAPIVRLNATLLPQNEEDKRQRDRIRDPSLFLYNKMRLIIDNNLLSMNMARNRQRSMPFLENGRVVYFKVVAVKSNPVELRSAPSRTVSVELRARSDSGNGF
ncbi:MAG: hypothetical protein HS115_10725 [Spirochaetales bacterium]|nr:hypothetical protein [Spirochaetales bacterium]